MAARVPLWKKALVNSMALFGRSAATWTASSIGLTGYNATDPRRKILSNARRPGSMTANELSTSSLPQLRNYSRQLERNNPTARAAVDGLVALVVGSGIDLEPDTGDKKTDELIRKEWKDWCDSCCVDGRDIFQLQGQAFRDVVVAGEGLWRLVVLPERAEQGQIPLCVLPLEPEWLDDNAMGVAYTQAPDGTTQVGPIAMDKYGRAVNYRLKNPDLTAPWQSETVPATAILHFFEKRRSMQLRGEPWLAPVIETLQQERDLVDAELQAAVTSSSIGIAVTSSMHDTLDTEEEGDTEDPAHSLRIGGVARLFPGDDVKSFANTRPSQQIMPFRAGLRGDTAAALRVPQRYLDRDVSRANYSSMRADMLDTDRVLSPVREWYGHATIGRLYKEVLPFLALRAGVAVPRAKYRLIPDGQPYVDPYKDAQAAALAIASGLTTFEAEIGKRGGDWTKIWEQLKREQEQAAKMGIKIDLSGTNAPAPQSSIGAVDQSKPGSAPAQPVSAEQEDDDKDDDGEDMKRSDLVAVARALGESMRPAPVAAPNTEVRVINETRMDEKTAQLMGEAIARNTVQTVNVAAPTVNVAQPVINVAAPEVRNEIAAPIIPAPVVNVAAPTVNVAAPNVTVENQTIVPQRPIRASQQRDGSLLLEPQGE